MIWIEHIGMNQEDQLFVDSEYLFIIQSFNIKLERVTIKRFSKLPYIEMIDVRLGRSIINSFLSISLSIINEQDESYIPASAYSPNSIEIKLGRSINYLLIKYT